MSMPAADLPSRHRLTVRDYYRMAETGILTPDQRVEFIEGEIIDMPPIGSPHGGIVKRLARAFSRAVGEHALLSVQDPVRLDDLSEPEPDIALLRPREDCYTRSHPGPTDVLLLVEVADNSLAYDRDIKLPLYARHGIPEVWLVDLAGRCVVRCRQPGNGAYGCREEIRTPGHQSIDALPGCTVDLAGLFDFLP